MLPQDLKTNATESEGMEKIFQANGNGKKLGQQYLKSDKMVGAIFISDTMNFKTKAVTADKADYIMIKGSIQ